MYVQLSSALLLVLAVAGVESKQVYLRAGDASKNATVAAEEWRQLNVEKVNMDDVEVDRSLVV